MNLALGTAALGLTGWASVAAESTARAMSAAATGFQGTRTLVKEQVYRKSLSEAIIRLIEADREKLRATLRTKALLPISAYGIEQAIADAEAYHLTGSFYHGLGLLQQAAEQKAKELKEEKDEEDAKTEPNRAPGGSGATTQPDQD